jgi:hypothetical protein
MIRDLDSDEPPMSTPELPSDVLTDILSAKPRGAQARFAEAMAVRPQTVTKWMSGENELNVIRWLEAERALDVEALTIARRTNPELAQLFEGMEGAALEESWRRAWAVGRERAQNEAQDAAAWRASVNQLLATLRSLLDGNSAMGGELVRLVAIAIDRAVWMQLGIYLRLSNDLTDDLADDTHVARTVRRLAAAVSPRLAVPAGKVTSQIIAELQTELRHRIVEAESKTYTRLATTEPSEAGKAAPVIQLNREKPARAAARKGTPKVPRARTSRPHPPAEE